MSLAKGNDGPFSERIFGMWNSGGRGLVFEIGTSYRSGRRR